MKTLSITILQKPIGTLMLALALASGGAWAGFNMRLDFLPDFSVPKLTVIAQYQGLPAEEIRSLITIPLEDSLSSLGGLKNMKSISRDGLSLIELKFPWGTDRTLAGIETREIIDTAYLNLPSKAPKPQVLPLDPGDIPIIVIGVYPHDGDLCLARRLADRELRSRLQRIEGVGSIQVAGGLEEEIHVDTDPFLLAARGYSLGDLTAALGNSNIDHPSGTITEGRIEYLVKTKANTAGLKELGEIYLPEPRETKHSDKSTLQLKDVAEITWSTKKQTSVFYYQSGGEAGKEGIRILIRRQSGFSPRKMAVNINRELERLRKSFGDDLEIQILLDRSISLDRSLKDLARALCLGSIIAFSVLLLFLRSLTQALILLVSLPASLLSALLLLFLCGRSLNLMSLGGLTMGAGMVIDNAIVVTERLVRHVDKSRSRTESIDIISEVIVSLAPPLIGSTLTTIIVFIPLFFIRGIAGALFGDLALGIIFAIGASLLFSLTVIPVLYLILNPASQKRQREIVLIQFCRRILRLTFRHPVFTSIITSGLCLSGFFLLGCLQREVIPPVNEGLLSCSIQMPPGTDIKTMKTLASDSIGKIREITEIREIHAWAGGEPGDPYYLASTVEAEEILQLRVLFIPGTGREAIALKLANLIKLQSGRFSILPEENILENLLGIRNSHDWALTGDEPRQTRTAAEDLLTELKAENLYSEVPSLEPAEKKGLLRLYPDREALLALGMELPELSQQLGVALLGSIPTRMLQEGREIDVRLRINAENRQNKEDITELTLPGSNLTPIQVGSLARLKEEAALPYLIRENRADISLIRFQHSIDDSLADRLEDAGGVSQSASILKQQYKEILLLFIIAFILLYLCLGIQFESFSLPLLLMLSIPLGIGGIGYALFLSSSSINLNSSLGLLVLMGISVNNGILLYEESKNMHSRPGATVIGTLYRGTASRLRPILMTSLTTTLALLPMAIDPAGKSSQASLAVSIIGGLAASTILSLMLLPQVFRVKFKKDEKSKIDIRIL
jgi:multidrug efflux pump subunit AcrB